MYVKNTKSNRKNTFIIYTNLLLLLPPYHKIDWGHESKSRIHLIKNVDDQMPILTPTLCLYPGMGLGMHKPQTLAVCQPAPLFQIQINKFNHPKLSFLHHKTNTTGVTQKLCMEGVKILGTIKTYHKQSYFVIKR